MKILITGANGMLARAVGAHCRSIGDDVTAYAHSELDISDSTIVFQRMADLRPDAVLNCAAYTDVDGAEADIQAAYDANATGVENLAAVCRQVDARFVTVSTDYVFDGEKPGFYTQRDTPNPRGVYAKTKYYGEILARNTYARSVIVRSGWIFGRGGTNFLSVVHKLLSDGTPIKAIDDAFGTPTFASDLARRLRELADLDLPFVFHVSNAGKGTSYLGFAEKVCEIGGYDRREIGSISGNALQRPAPRPVNSRLACVLSERLGLAALPAWEQSLEQFLIRES
jgi:dTDP-4-dehydrorhamnose reductase